MRRVMTGLVVMLVWAISAAAAGADDGRATVTVRIHDYVALPEKPLARAQSLVSAYYRAIHVETKWRAVMQPLRQPPPRGPARSHDRRDLTVIILSNAMAQEKQLPDDAVGSAATTTEAPGRIAYVLYDRVVAAALGAGWDPVDFMGVVIAHEIGHLLLPHGSHTSDGLMRGHWAMDDLRNVDRSTLRFSEGQAEQMRQMLLGYDLAPQMADGRSGP
jgi:hypothetical protein